MSHLRPMKSDASNRKTRTARKAALNSGGFGRKVNRLHKKYVEAIDLLTEARNQLADAQSAVKDAEEWLDEAHNEYWKARKEHGRA